MNIEELTQLVVNALEDVKAKDIKVFNTEGLTDQFERVVIASGTSNRQTRALAYSVSHEVKQAGGDVLGMEGQETGEWVLVTSAPSSATACSPTSATTTTSKRSGAARKSS